MRETKSSFSKRTIVFLLITALALPLGIAGFGRSMSTVEAEGTATRYFYDQLTGKEKPFYNALDEMYTSGMLKTGTENLELTENGSTAYVTQEDLASFANGYPDLLNWMGAARDAFSFDHPDLFYVDFSAISLRVTMDENGIYHAYLGTGRRSDYYNGAFSNEDQVNKAVAEYEETLKKIVEEAKNLKVDETMDRTRQQIIWVHNYVVDHTGYKLESDYTDTSDNGIYLIRTAYGSLVNGASACEGYSRAVKAILDRLDIPCVLVQGVYLYTENQPELHMWNNVKLDDKWYGLDATMDDPKGGPVTTEYLLVGEDVMGVHHVPNKVISSANREFNYPVLTNLGVGYEVLQENNGLKVEYKTDRFEGLEAGYFRVSYEGMGYAKAAEQGKYILARYYQYHLGDDIDDPGTYSHAEWFYADPSIYEINKIQEPQALILPLPQCMYAEFAVTDIAPNLPEDISQFDPDKHSYFYEGDPLLFVAQSKQIYNPSGLYIAPPYPVSITPSGTSRMVMEQSYDVSITYNDRLIPVEGEKPWYKMIATGPTAEKYSKIENFKWDGDRTISFRFSPSQMYADESTYYYFTVTGLVGETSGKAPIETTYAIASGKSPYGCPLCADYYNWQLFAKPSLLENSDLSLTGWETEDGSPVSELLKDRIALVVSNPSAKQDAAMQEMLEEQNDGHEILSSATYNITLTVCKMMVVQTGQSVKVSVGFPEGYGPEDEGVTFKAYHFMRDKAGNVIGVEEIPCVVTKFGLIITCDSFSPFAIAAVDQPRDTTYRTANLYRTVGGSITCKEKDGIISLKEGETASLTVTADDGYVIDAIHIGSNAVTDVAGETLVTLTITYDDLQTEYNIASIIDANFVAKTIYEEEKEKGESIIQPAPDEIIVPAMEQGTDPTPAPTVPSPDIPESPDVDDEGTRQEDSPTESPAQQESPNTPAPAPDPEPATPDSATPVPDTPVPVTPVPATPVPTNAAAGGANPSVTKVPPSTPVPTATAGTVQANNGSGDKASSETAAPAGGTVAFVDQDNKQTENDTGHLTLSKEDSTSNDSHLYWLILPILAGAFAVGGGLYYAFGRKR